MNIFTTMLRRLKAGLGIGKATPETDPWVFLAGIAALPNPDPLLRRMGMAEEVYATVIRDAHVIGEVRANRGQFRSWNYRLKVGAPDDPASVRAHAIAEQWMTTMSPMGPHGSMSVGLEPDWLEIMWQMSMATYHGYRVHELVWQVVNGQYLPSVIDRPNRRIQFDAAGAPMLITRSAQLAGEPITNPWEFAISRHMADATNPYGISLLSICWYWHLFKTGGGRQLVKLCERHGLPWPVGRHPAGMSDADLDAFERALAEMVESGYVLAPEGTSLELLTANLGSGDLPQEVLIKRCNLEMSKALTGQSQMAELGAVGSRASADVAADRNASIADSDRDIAVQTFNRILRWITVFNVGDQVAPPTLEFYRDAKAGKERAETYEVAVRLGAKPSRKAMLDELGMPAAVDDADALTLPGTSAPPVTKAAFSAGDLPNLPVYQFAAASGLTDDDMLDMASQAADATIADKFIGPVAQMLADFEASGKSLQDAADHLVTLTGAMDDAELQDIVRRALMWSMATGALKPPTED